MDFDLTKEQQLLSDAVQRFVAKEYSFAAREAILDSKEGWSREVWAKLAELGLLGLQVPEEHGGMDGASADALLVSARTAGAPHDRRGISLFIVPRGAPGVSLQTYRTLDGQRASDVALRDVRIPAGGLLGPEGGAFEAISAAWDLGIAAICAEAAGALQALLDTTVEYAKTRKQFGVPIGKFQALQHRMVEMLIQVEQARSMSYPAAIRATDPDPAERRRAVSAAKVVIGQACRNVGQEAVQIHGGMGMTDELHVGHYFKRLTAIELSLGDTEHSLETFVRETAARKETA